MSLAPVVIFTYNRYDELMKVMDALAGNLLAGKTDVFVFSNAPVKDVEDDEECVKKVRDGLKKYEKAFNKYTVVYREKNNGPNENMIDGINYVMNIYGKAIMVEDDIVTAPAFLDFMNQALDKYEADSDIFSICGYNPTKLKSRLKGDSFSYSAFRSWGWATWKDRWDMFDINENALKNVDLRKARSNGLIYITPICSDISYGDYRTEKYKNKRFLDIRLFHKQTALNKKVIYPKRSLCDNIGMGEKGLTTGISVDCINENFDGKYEDNYFDFSKEELTMKSDREYYIDFRKSVFLMHAFEKFTFDRNWLYADMYHAVTRLWRRNESIERYLKKYNIKKVGICGWRSSGQLLYDMLKKSGAEIVFIMDKGKDLTEASVPIYKNIREAWEVSEADAIIVSALKAFFDIEEELSGIIDCPIICMNDCIYESLMMSDEEYGYKGVNHYID